jgi:putative DNA-invertase from lambdoid prophage Rac
LLALLKPGDVGITPKAGSPVGPDMLELLPKLKPMTPPYTDRPRGAVTGNRISILAFTIVSAGAEAERDRICAGDAGATSPTAIDISVRTVA